MEYQFLEKSRWKDDLRSEASVVGVVYHCSDIREDARMRLLGVHLNRRGRKYTQDNMEILINGKLKNCWRAKDEMK